MSEWVIEGIGSYSIPPGTTLAVGEYLVVYRDPGAVAFYSLTNCVGPYAPSNLSNGGESITLKNSSLVTIDSVTYDDDWPWYSEADGGGPSLELIVINRDLLKRPVEGLFFWMKLGISILIFKRNFSGFFRREKFGA